MSDYSLFFDGVIRSLADYLGSDAGMYIASFFALFFVLRFFRRRSVPPSLPGRIPLDMNAAWFASLRGRCISSRCSSCCLILSPDELTCSRCGTVHSS